MWPPYTTIFFLGSLGRRRCEGFEVDSRFMHARRGVFVTLTPCPGPPDHRDRTRPPHPPRIYFAWPLWTPERLRHPSGGVPEVGIRCMVQVARPPPPPPPRVLACRGGAGR